MLVEMEYRLRSCYSPSAELQQWLQLTYEIETRYFEKKRLAADSQLKAAKDMVGDMSHVMMMNIIILSFQMFVLAQSVFLSFPSPLLGLSCGDCLKDKSYDYQICSVLYLCHTCAQS